MRRSLQRLSVIEYKCNQYEHYIFINWTVIRGYALLAMTRERTGITEPLEVGGNKRKYFVQESQNEYMNHPLREIWKEYPCYLAHMNRYEIQQTLEILEDKQL